MVMVLLCILILYIIIIIHVLSNTMHCASAGTTPTYYTASCEGTCALPCALWYNVINTALLHVVVEIVMVP
jgi:hypothetical protein